MIEFAISFVAIYLVFIAYQSGKLITEIKYLRLIRAFMDANSKDLFEGWDEISELYGTDVVLTYSGITNKIIDNLNILLELDKE